MWSVHQHRPSSTTFSERAIIFKHNCPSISLVHIHSISFINSYNFPFLQPSSFRSSIYSSPALLSRLFFSLVLTLYLFICLSWSFSFSFSFFYLFRSPLFAATSLSLFCLLTCNIWVNNTQRSYRSLEFIWRHAFMDYDWHETRQQWPNHWPNKRNQFCSAIMPINSTHRQRRVLCSSSWARPSRLLRISVAISLPSYCTQESTQRPVWRSTDRLTDWGLGSQSLKQALSENPNSFFKVQLP